jgi:hypothetical protein
MSICVGDGGIARMKAQKRMSVRKRPSCSFEEQFCENISIAVV